ncbi:MAG: PhzF family phenazine biosynthesis protein [Woeseiaceae bacterium]
MTTQGKLQTLSAFTQTPDGGNPAGVWIGETFPPDSEMQEIAKVVGYSETVFVTPAKGKQRSVRYFSPEAEVPFCGHATIAAGVALANEGNDGAFVFETKSGDVTVTTTADGDVRMATLTSVLPSHVIATETLVEQALDALHWSLDDLNPSIPPAVAYAGAFHLVLAVSEKSRLDRLDYDFESLKALMLEADLTTLQLVWKSGESTFDVRNPFPVGGVVEDPATGAAAAALGGYLRDAQLLDAPIRLQLTQGEIMGRPSQIVVDIPATGGISVSGAAVLL